MRETFCVCLNGYVFKVIPWSNILKRLDEVLTPQEQVQLQTMKRKYGRSHRHSFIHSFIQQGSSYDVPGTVFGTEDAAGNKADTHFPPSPKSSRDLCYGPKDNVGQSVLNRLAVLWKAIPYLTFSALLEKSSHVTICPLVHKSGQGCAWLSRRHSLPIHIYSTPWKYISIFLLTVCKGQCCQQTG